jgi:hypothetical protein
MTMENSEQKNSVIKDPCEQYYVTVPGHSWTTFTISAKGDFFIHGDWGYWCNNWRSFGSDFKSFLMSINADYLINCLERNAIQFQGLKKKLNKRQIEAITELFKAFQSALKEEICIGL